MASNMFLFSEALAAERLSWIAESLKIFFVSLHPDALRHPSREKNPFFTFFLTGDALYSLHEEETRGIWDIILSLPSVWLVCDRKELDLLGLSVSSLKIKFPGSVFDQDRTPDNEARSFWQEIIRACQNLDPVAGTIGYLQVSSPYMNRSCQNSLSCLRAAAGEKLVPELYAYLDGVHACHNNQDPGDFRNIGAGYEDLENNCRRNGLQFPVLACGRSAAARGYNTLDDGKGTVVSTCTIEPCRIRNLKVLIERFRRNHVILGESAGLIDISQSQGAGREIWEKKEPTPPSLVIMLTHSPYGTGYTLGGLSFAIACAHHGIATRVIFIENGIYSLTGTQVADPEDVFYNIQEVIDAAGGCPNLEMYAFMLSFHLRNIQKNRKMNAVLDIGPNELTALLFSPARGVDARHQRILIF